MEILSIAAGQSSPAILFDPNTNKLKMTGESYPENTASFYEPIFNWLNQYLIQQKDNDIIFEIELLYFNSSSSKALADIFDLFVKHLNEQKSICINWRYHEENDMSLEYGEEFQEDYPTLNFNLIEFTDS